MTTLFISHSSKDKAWASEVHEALRGQGYDKLFLDSHPDDGIPAGAKWEQDLWQHLRQSGAVVVLCTANWIASPWCVAEAMIARERGKPVFMLASGDVSDGRQVKGTAEAGPQIPDFLKDTQFISLAGTTIDEAYQRLWRGLAGLKKDIFPLPDRPYPGLMAFDEKDAAVFFGRDAEIAEVNEVLNRRLRNNAKGFILILGASGCGKSSLVRAGVLPQLKRPSDGSDSDGRWVIPSPFLGSRGLGGLAMSLATALKEAGQPSDLAAVRGRLEPDRESNDGMERAARALGELASELMFARGLTEGAVLLVLDQLEEVFGTPDGSEARATLRLLLDASVDAASSIVVLATMRSDFLNAFQQFEGAAERYEEVTLDPMLRSRFGEVIEGPADRFGLDLDGGLSAQMVEETAYNDALPLLAFTLNELYERCRAQGRLTRAAYHELGGVNAAIKRVADKILEQTSYKKLPADAHRDLRRAFYSLAQVGKEGQFTRRTALWSRMPNSCEAILKRFVGQRLLVSGADENREPTVTVAHEALFRVWDTLNGWLRDDRKALAFRAQIKDAAAEWQAANRAESRMWPEERILDAVSEIEKSGVSIADVENRATVDAFLGPTDPKTLEALLGLTAAEDATAGSGRYGEVWRLPLSHAARASTGVRLALLDDRRKGARLRADGLPDIDWRWIDAGEVTIEIRSNPDDPNSEVVKRLTRTVEHFWMARYPVTIVQFQAFLNEFYQDGSWHLPAGFVNMPANYPPPKHRERHGNYPADNVNWWDASAFCHWLGARFGFEVRLPTEYEWQLAATGGKPARTYPWGPDWDPEQEPWRANTSESGLSRSTAVGMYPAGALDMAGTVWEWCRNAFDNPDNDGFPQSPEDYRALRGGSWLFDQDFARSAVRDRDFPDLRYSGIGFRVVCSSTLFETHQSGCDGRGYHTPAGS